MRLFSYGTLQFSAVQRANFGRELTGHADALVGYAMTTVAISDPHVVLLSGARYHPIAAATGDDTDRVEGIVFQITEAELIAADGYEVEEYVRVHTILASGTPA